MVRNFPYRNLVSCIISTIQIPLVELTVLKYGTKYWGTAKMNDVFKLENVVEGMKITTKGKVECDTCVQGKMSQYRNREPDCRASSPLQLVHSDLAGPITPESKDGHKYAMVFVDDYSGALGVYFLKNNSIICAIRSLAYICILCVWNPYMCRWSCVPWVFRGRCI